MALIKCPECGNSISNTVAQCVHCGCKIRSCPECGEVYNIETIDVCSACGYVFSHKNASTGAKNLTVSDVATDWIVENRKKETKRKPLLIIALLLGLSTIAILGFWKYGNPLEALANYTFIKFLTIIFSVVSAVLYFIYLYTKKNDEYTTKIEFTSYAKKNGIDNQILIKDYADNNFMGKTVNQIRDERTTAATVLDAAVMREDAAYNLSFQRYVSIYCVLSFLIHGVVSFFLVSNIIGFLEHALWETGTYFGSFKMLWLLAIAFGIFVLRCILSFAHSNKSSVAQKKWFEKNMPEYETKFTQRITDSLKY